MMGIIEKEYIDIMRKLQGATLFGEPVDLQNNVQLLISAYHLGQQEAADENQRQNEFKEFLRSKTPWPHSIGG